MATRIHQREFRSARDVAKMNVKLDPALVEGFQKTYLMDGFDDAAGTAPFHREMWEDACDPKNSHCAWAAPRGHSKSSSITFTFLLTALMFGVFDYAVIASDSEGQASQHLKELKNQFYENEEMRKDFGVKHFIVDTGTEFEIEFKTGRVIRVIAKGSEQRIRGIKWRGKRPDVIVGDDLEYDEVVMNPDRRKKFSDWFFKALLPAGSKACRVLIVGTILHYDSLLSNLMTDPEWTTRLWSAHESFDDFTGILWPERYDEAYFKKLRQRFINQGKSDAYSQEYLNRPIAEGNTFFDESGMKAVPEDRIFQYEDKDDRQALGLNTYCSIDLAISTKRSADRTVFTVATMDSDAYLDIMHVEAGRFTSREIVDLFFKVAEEHNPDVFFVEAGAIEKAIGPFLNEEMAKRRKFLSLHLMTPGQDKVTRARSIQARMDAGRVRFNKTAPWWEGFKNEMLQFPRGSHDDHVDTISQLGLALEEIIIPLSEEELDEEEWERDRRDSVADGRSSVTGY